MAAARLRHLYPIKWYTHLAAGKAQLHSASHDKQDTHSSPGPCMVFIILSTVIIISDDAVLISPLFL